MGSTTEYKNKSSEMYEKDDIESTISSSYAPTSFSTLKDLMCPFSIDLKNLNYIKFVSHLPRYARTFFVNTLPRFLRFGEFLKPLYNFGNTNTSIFIYPIQEGICQSNLNEIISQLEGEIQESQDDQDRSKFNTLILKKLEAENLRDEIASKFNMLFEVTVLSTVFTKTPEELDHLSELYGLENSKSLVNIKSMWSEQELGFRSNMPCCNNKILKNNTFDCFAAATVFPFWTLNISHPSGVPFGNNIQTDTPIYLDDFYPALSNLNFFVFGNDDSNKKTAVKLLISRSTVLDYIQNIIIDTKGSFRKITKTLDGTTIKIGSNCNNIFNPFDIDIETVKDEITGRERTVLNLNQKIENVTNILMTMARGPIKSQYVNDITRDIIQQTVEEEYSSLGITTNPESLYSSHGANLIGTKITRNRKQLPTISSWYRRLQSKATANMSIDYKYHYEFLIKYMRDFVSEVGGQISYFDGQTTFEMPEDTSIVNFDISHLDSTFAKPLAIQVLLCWLSQKYINSNSEERVKAHKKRIVVDEAQIALPFPEAVNSLCHTLEQASKRNVCLLVVASNIRDFCTNSKLEKIMKNASLKLLMRHQGVETEYARVTFNLTVGERNFIGSCPRNDGIIIINNNSAQLSITQNEYENMII